MKSIVGTTVCTIVFAGATFMNFVIVAARGPTAQEQETAPAPDNTKMNKGDRAKGKLTADQQGQNASDRELSRKLRQSIMQDKAPSMYAHNVKIITKDTMVTLRGPVRSDEEKRAVETKAKEVTGDEKVTDELKVMGKKTS